MQLKSGEEKINVDWHQSTLIAQQLIQPERNQLGFHSQGRMPISIRPARLIQRSTAFMNLKYKEIARLTPSEIESAILRNEPRELSRAVLAAALYPDDPQWAQAICVRLFDHANANVRGNAVLGFGHIARIARQLTEEWVKPIIETALGDPDSYVRGHAHSAADDVEFFLNWQVNRPR